MRPKRMHVTNGYARTFPWFLRNGQRLCLLQERGMVQSLSDHRALVLVLLLVLIVVPPNDGGAVTAGNIKMH